MSMTSSIRTDGNAGWQPIETAPKDGTDMLVYQNGCFDVASVWWIDDNGDAVWFNGDVVVYPTHWMPLPDPPDDGEEK
jgi:hypothetical protein